MHRALLLPEIVTAIVRSGKTEPGLLYNCLFVNKLFFLEACRILWKGCYGIFGVGHMSPRISDLANMVLRRDIGRNRAQFYANFIRVLVFQEDDVEGGSDTDDARWHLQLRELNFPLLEDLNIWKTNSAEKFNKEADILHYIHPGLRDLRVDASGPLSDLFLDEVSRLCPHLQQLDIDFRNVTITKKGLARFLQKMTYLKGVHVAALVDSWSTQALAAVATYERLQLLHIPATPYAWFDNIEIASSSVPFPALRYLYCLGTTGKALHRLHDMNSRLEALHVYNSSLGGLEDVLPAAARFTRLTKFRYQPGPNAHITGSSLVSLAQSCRSLTSLSIGQEQATLPTGIEITDRIVHLLAQALPSLEELFLLVNAEAGFLPGIASILSSLSQHCTKLKQLEISCEPDWQSITSLPTQVLLPNICAIALRPQLHMEDFMSDTQHKKLLTYFQTNAAEWFPRIECFTTHDADMFEQAFDDHVFHVSYKREHGHGIDSDEENGDEATDLSLDVLANHTDGIEISEHNAS